MYKLIRFYNQNRNQIIKIILIIVFILGIIQLLNYLVSRNGSNNNIQANMINNNNMRQEIASNKSLVTGQTLPTTSLKSDNEVIKNFVEACNKGDIDTAYNFLTEECKENMFPTIDDFERIYYSYIFNSYQTYTLENWSGDIYQIKYTEDILNTGNLNSTTKQDYITIINKNGEKKLNINNYIGRENLNKTTEQANIKITITSIDTFMDYEIYNLSIENNSKNDILLDTSDDVKSIYLLDNKEMKYYFFSNEIVDNKLLIKSNFVNSLQIKFASSYSSSKKINNVVFSKMVLNYDEYKNFSNKKEYSFYKFRVNVY